MYIMLYKSIFLMFCYLSIANAFIHRVDEGSVGIYYKMGALSETITDPGTHPILPWPITSASSVQITPQTDKIDNVKCGAGDGTQLNFPEVEVGNILAKDMVYRTIKRFTEYYDDYLVKDKIRAQLNVICSSLTSHEIYITKFHTLDDLLLKYLQEENNKESESGVIINFVRLSKPIPPKELQDNYNKIANEKTALQVAITKGHRLEQEHKNEMMKTKSEAERRRVTADTDNMIKLDKVEMEEKESTIKRRIKSDNQLSEANSLYIKKEKEAEGNSKLHTPEYIEIRKTESMFNNAKHYFGKVPNTLFIKDNEQTTTEEVVSS